MLGVVRALISALLSILVWNVAVAAIPPVATLQHTCSVVSAASYGEVAERYRKHGDVAAAAAWFEAAARLTDGCASADGALINARSLVAAGAAFAKTGDYPRALALAGRAHERLHAIATADPRDAAQARTDLDIVDGLISAINTFAQASM